MGEKIEKTNFKNLVITSEKRKEIFRKINLLSEERKITNEELYFCDDNGLNSRDYLNAKTNLRVFDNDELKQIFKFVDKKKIMKIFAKEDCEIDEIINKIDIFIAPGWSGGNNTMFQLDMFELVKLDENKKFMPFISFEYLELFMSKYCDRNNEFIDQRICDLAGVEIAKYMFDDYIPITWFTKYNSSPKRKYFVKYYLSNKHYEDLDYRFGDIYNCSYKLHEDYYKHLKRYPFEIETTDGLELVTKNYTERQRMLITIFSVLNSEEQYIKFANFITRNSYENIYDIVIDFLPNLKSMYLNVFGRQRTIEMIISTLISMEK